MVIWEFAIGGLCNQKGLLQGSDPYVEIWNVTRGYPGKKGERLVCANLQYRLSNDWHKSYKN
jgi:hypothetical protein